LKRPIQNRSSPLVYLITDRSRVVDCGDEALLDLIERAVAAGVDLVQLRERDLCARRLFRLAEAGVDMARRYGAMFLINDRADIAAALPGAGVHLTTRSIGASIIREKFGNDIPIGVSTHSAAEVESAERAGADFVVFGPVFETESKKQYGPPVGLAALRSVVSRAALPVLALGGINERNLSEVLAAGAHGVAGISLFIDELDLEGLVSRIKKAAVH
jgi:thiamine-phosphate pyrophosphorylase